MRHALFSPPTCILAAVLLAACDSGPSEGEFLAACRQEGKRSANSMGMRAAERDAYCRCAAGAAEAGVSPDGYRLMVLEMQGDKHQEIAALHARMKDEEKMAVMKAAFDVLGKCAGAVR